MADGGLDRTPVLDRVERRIGAGRKPRSEGFGSPLLEAWRRAHYEQSAVYDLPYTVAEGFAAKHGIDREVFLERIAPRLTRLERLRLQEAARAAGADSVRADLATMPLTRPATYVLSLPLDERAARRAELTAALRAAARRAAGARSGTWGRVAAVLDDSFSSFGSTRKRRRPLAVALGCHFLLEALADDFIPLWLSGGRDPLPRYPYGATPLGERIPDALEHRPDRLLIVSDGWDNAPPGLAGEVLRVWRTRLDPGHRTGVVHLNPVYDAAGFDVRRLAPGVPTAGVRDAEDLPTLVEFARFTEGRTGLAELRAHLDAHLDGRRDPGRGVRHTAAAAQTRRGHLLTLLAAHDWHFGATADALRVSRDQLASHVEHAGFGALLRQDIRDQYRAAARGTAP